MTTNGDRADILLFEMADRRGGLFLSDVLKVLRAMAITALPKAPYFIEGVINVRGEIVPVIDLRVRFGLPRQKVALTDRFILVSVGSRIVAMRVDEVSTIATIDTKDIEDATQIAPEPASLLGVAKLKDGLAIIYDVQSFISATEEEELNRALAESART